MTPPAFINCRDCIRFVHVPFTVGRCKMLRGFRDQLANADTHPEQYPSIVDIRLGPCIDAKHFEKREAA